MDGMPREHGCAGAIKQKKEYWDFGQESASADISFVS
jgi:hypothetical protein